MHITTDPTLLVWPPDTDAASARFLARGFGSSRADLDVDFGAKPRALVVTALLSYCLCDRDGRAFDTDTLWEWSVAARLQGLLSIAYASAGPMTAAVATCNHVGCAERIELELALADFALATPDRIDWQTPDQQQASLRLPAGVDQMAWYHHHSERDAADTLWFARRLITHLDAAPPAADWELPSTWLTPLGSALATADPLTALTVRAPCPACAAELAIEVDLEYLLLEVCRRQQRALFDDIHHIAGVYHWSEADIVAMPPWRRARYLSRIQAYSS